MKPNIVKAGICAAVSAAMTVTLSGVTASAEPISPDMATKLAGKTVFLDPGHQGPNHTENLSRQVSDGRGGTKDCQTTGMTSLNGVAEHTINWNVAQLVKTSLESLGAEVLLSRQDDSGWGGCIDERARAANESGAAVAISIHADGAPAQYRGFHVIVPQLPIPDAAADRAQSTGGLAASKSMRDAYLSSGFPSANYAGVVDGLQTRADVAGPALTTVPDVFIEMGNGANPEDAALLESDDGQLKHAIAITTGLVGYLLGAPPAGDTPVAAPESGVDSPAVAPAPAPQTPAAAPESPAPSTTTTPSTTTAPTTEPAPAGAPAPSTSQAPTTTTTTTAPAAPAQRPGINNSRTAPGANTPQSTPSTTTPKATPGTTTPPSGSSSKTPEPESDNGVVGTVMELLMPLAKALGMDDTAITAELINLAYTLAAALFSPTD
ncbi:N-acetylmuramoyl-L-alanine amidase [Nocardia cyriacigeorgica]|uniref:N-acetylmuramoyl-L-alanine amidase n=1 Tax=Nocardia cyriacigeorgica TaxID=135487 RepID=A0A6P1DCL5_9NOCA|nr:N-acetylmuramoyl-L-alanine amidase [Nocardia cyriacigeorgica]NEW46373.1 N-acetylmuramoyl-L-alanine amidase [Nocardia cyriacigeorgica]